MKRNIYIFLLSVFMTSCANLTSPTATITPQTTVTHTPTFTPTFTPTITPTITRTPTETPDPNKPSDATGRDSSTGEYTKTVEENGKTRVYVWKQFQFGDDAKNGISGHWFRSWMENGPINLTEYSEVCQGFGGGPFSLNINVYAVEGQTDLDKIGYIFHPDREVEWNKYKDVTWGGLSCTSLSLPENITDGLFLQYMGLLSGEPGDNPIKRHEKFMDHYYPGGNLTGEGRQHFINDREAFVKALNNGATIKLGDELWVPQKGYEVYWINESMAVNDPTMVVDLSGYKTIKDYYLKVIVKDGKLTVFIAPAKWLKDQLVRPKDKRERIFKSMILFPLEAAITSTYPIENANFLPFQDYQGNTAIISGAINGHSVHIDIPFIDFTSDQ